MEDSNISKIKELINRIKLIKEDNFNIYSKEYEKIVDAIKKYDQGYAFQRKLNYIKTDILENRGRSYRSELLIILNDLLFKLTNDLSDKENLLILKIIECRFNNSSFELSLAKMIIGDNPKFPYKSSSQITEFFNALGYPYTHDGSTRKYWVEGILRIISSKDLYEKIIATGLFNKLYFTEYCKAQNIDDLEKLINDAKNEFKELISDSKNRYSFIDISDCFDLNINTELLFNNTITTEDNELNDLINKAKKYFIEGDKETAIEKLWDGFERIKTFDFNTNKKVSSEKLLEKISVNILKEDFELEFKQLTEIGNRYKIRHSETNKIPIHDQQTLNYLFFRMFSLLNLCIVKVQ